jgi:glutamyl/glutaminyl-tRNA synthetase
VAAKCRTRFAPTPNGYLHLGNVYNLIWVAIHAKRNKAEVGLRIDDYDLTRYRKHFVDEIFMVLDAIGFKWAIGPQGTTDFEQNFSSKHRQDLYRDAQLQAKQSPRTYWCVCTRKQEGGAHVYSGKCRSLGLSETSRNAEGFKAQLRFSVSDEFLKSSIGDFILLPRGKELSYHLASVVDDCHFGYNLIVRGDDLAPSSLAQKELSVHIGCEQFSATTIFEHHSLITSKDGQKLSKSQKSTPVHDILRQIDGRQKVFFGFCQKYGKVVDKFEDVPDGWDEFIDWFGG